MLRCRRTRKPIGEQMSSRSIDKILSLLYEEVRFVRSALVLSGQAWRFAKVEGIRGYLWLFRRRRRTCDRMRLVKARLCASLKKSGRELSLWSETQPRSCFFFCFGSLRLASVLSTECFCLRSPKWSSKESSTPQLGS